MIPKLLIILGGILTGIGVIGFAALSFEPFFRAINIVFKRKDDYVFYETKPGKILLQKEYRALVRGFSFMLVSGIILLVLGLYLKSSRTGNDSIFSKDVPGITTGEEASQINNPDGTPRGDKYVDEAGNEYAYYIVVTKNDISVNGIQISDLNILKDVLSNIDRTNTVFLVDDFAASKTFLDVMDLLDECGMRYKTEE